jgi:hypothetical protein
MHYKCKQINDKIFNLFDSFEAVEILDARSIKKVDKPRGHRKFIDSESHRR